MTHGYEAFDMPNQVSYVSNEWHRLLDFLMTIDKTYSFPINLSDPRKEVRIPSFSNIILKFMTPPLTSNKAHSIPPYYLLNPINSTNNQPMSVINKPFLKHLTLHN
jgi:hypothetical protein